MKKVRTRIAPSPSSRPADEKNPNGYGIHIGNLKTGLVNYLFAMQNGGDFIYRVEDSDAARTTKGADKVILDDLIWSGVKPTEGHLIGGPHKSYLQSERKHIYQKYVNYLLDKNYAYKCYCDSVSLDKQREEALAKDPKNPWKYPGTCRHQTKDFDRPYVVRFKTPTDGAIDFDNIVFGKKSFINKENFDFVIARSDGSFLYNLTVVCDDIDMEISHIIRGADHIKNFSSQYMLYNAFNANIPKMCHLSMMLNEQGLKLSKRDAAVSVCEWKSSGFSPMALNNYLIRFGWSFGNQELFSMEELISKFKLENCGKVDGRFNLKKFEHINTEHLKSTTLTPDASYAEHLSTFLLSLGHDLTTEQIIPLIPLVRTRSKTFVEAANELDPILRTEITIDQVAKEKLITEQVKRYLSIYNNLLDTITTWTEDNIRAATSWWLTANNLVLKDIGQPVRLAIVGRTNSPELFQTMAAIGKDRVMKRIADIIK